MTRSLSSAEQACRLLLFAIEGGPKADTNSLRQALNISEASLYRHLNTLVSAGLLVRVKRGDYRPSPQLLRSTQQHPLERLLVDISKPYLEMLSARRQATTHLGVWENNMVTYLTKVAKGEPIFTLEKTQLEAYCSALGKILLSGLPQPLQSAYLAEGPFPKLTENTITEPDLLAEELRSACVHGVAFDRGEVEPSLQCAAAPIKDGTGATIAAISISVYPTAGIHRHPFAADIQETAEIISGKLQGLRR